MRGERRRCSYATEWFEFSRFGDPDGLEVVDVPLPTANRGEVRVRVLASSLNYTEVLIRRHLYPQTMRLRPPFVMGYDVVGEIDQIGDDVRDFQIGERVADMTVVGSNADYRTLRAGDVVRVPAGVDPAEAATLILSWTTAYQLLHRARSARARARRRRRRRAGSARTREAGRPRLTRRLKASVRRGAWSVASVREAQGPSWGRRVHGPLSASMAH